MILSAWMTGFLLAVLSLLLVVRADEFDNVILAYMDDQNILGASVAYYNGVSVSW